MKRVCVWLLVVLAGAAGGCGGSGAGPGNQPAPDNEQALKELGEVYKYLQYENRPAPRKAADLEEFEGSLPAALPKVRAGDIVVVWNAGYAASSNQVLAYEKDAPASGGKVLLRNGTVKAMTAAEFADASKAK
jgi:hypothetical protein